MSEVLTDALFGGICALVGLAYIAKRRRDRDESWRKNYSDR